MTNKKNDPRPLVFVTGIGQTWTTLRGGRARWNLFPREKEIVFGGLSAKERLAFGRAAGAALRFLSLGGKAPSGKAFQGAVEALLRHCRADDNGDLPESLDVRIYGDRSFDVLGKTPFYPGDDGENAETLLSRLLRDVPCRDFIPEYGAENLYCFNYSPFTDLCRAAAALRETLEKIVEKHGGKTAVLVPMSMGAAVTLAYLDAYYTDEGSVGENLLHSVVSVVGAWDGSEGFADLITAKTAPDWRERFYGGFLPSQKLPPALLRLLTRRPARTDALLKAALDAFLDGVLMRTSALPALVPKGRWAEAYPFLFDPARKKRNSRFLAVQKETDRFIAAQKHLSARMRAANEACGVTFSFVAGTGLNPGDESNDFAFMKFLASAGREDTDGVLQLSSAMPFDLDAPPAWVRDFAVFDRQRHEIGNNPAALRLLFDLAAGKAAHVPHFVPRNEERSAEKQEDEE